MPKIGLKRPYVVAKSAQTIDGKVATKTGDSKWITSTESRVYARKQRDKFDAILVGAETVIKDNPHLTGVKHKGLKRVVVDSRLRISEKSKLFRGLESGQCIVATTRHANPRKLKLFKEKGVDVIVCPQKNKRVNLSKFFDKLVSKGIKRLLIEGGPTVIGSALAENLVDQLHVYIAPKLIGDSKALDSVVGLSPQKIKSVKAFKVLKQKRIGKDILVVADVYRNR